VIHNLNQAILSAKAPRGTNEAVVELGYDTPPSNQVILTASKKAYSQFQSAADSTAVALANLINTGLLRDAIARLDGVNWTSSGIDCGLVDPIYQSSDVQGAIGTARSLPQLHSFSVGVFAKSLPSGGLGMAGFGRDLTGAPTRRLELALDLYKGMVNTAPGSNLQLGIWLPGSSALHDYVTGMYVKTSVQGVSVNLKILLTKALLPYGFVVSSGATVRLPVDSAVFAGTTANWEC
jgi:hypothetical protein